MEAALSRLKKYGRKCNHIKLKYFMSKPTKENIGPVNMIHGCIYNMQKIYRGNEYESASTSCSVIPGSWWPHGLQSPGSSVHEILQARILEWIAIPFSRGSSWLRDQTRVIAGRFFPVWATREAWATNMNKSLRERFNKLTFLCVQLLPSFCCFPTETKKKFKLGSNHNPAWNLAVVP